MLPAARQLIAFILMTAFSFAHGREAIFYLGTYTNDSGGKGIYVGKLDVDSGKLGPVSVAAEAKNPSFIAVSPDGKFLYAAMEGDGGSVGAFAINKGGSLRFLNSQPSGGNGACHVSTDAQGRHVFVANYGGGNIACLPVRPDGSLGEKTAFVQFTGSGPHSTRQKKSFAHAIYSDPDDRFVYACDLGADKVWSFQFDKEKGMLTPTNPPAGNVPPGGGPRHLAFHPGGRFAYANNEMGLSVTAFSRDPETGILSPFQTVETSMKNKGPVEGMTSAEIICHPGGRWLYVSSRGDDIIAVYSIAEDGRLTLIENVPAGVLIPRGMAIDPTGKWIIVGGQKDNKLTVFAIDQQTGRLTPTTQSAEAPSPVGVTFVPLHPQGGAQSK